MLVIYKEDSSTEQTWSSILDAISKEGRSDVECPRWDVVEQGESISLTGCYAEQLGYKEAFFSFVPNREKMEEMKEDDGMLVLDFVWQSYQEFDLKMFRDAHLEFQKYLLELFPGVQTVIQITSQPTDYDWVVPVDHGAIAKA